MEWIINFLEKDLQFILQHKQFAAAKNHELPTWKCSFSIAEIQFEFHNIDTPKHKSDSFKNFMKHQAFMPVKELYKYLFILEKQLGKIHVQNIIFHITGTRSMKHIIHLNGKQKQLKRLVKSLTSQHWNEIRRTDIFSVYIYNRTSANMNRYYHKHHKSKKSGFVEFCSVDKYDIEKKEIERSNAIRLQKYNIEVLIVGIDRTIWYNGFQGGRIFEESILYKSITRFFSTLEKIQQSDAKVCLDTVVSSLEIPSEGYLTYTAEQFEGLVRSVYNYGLRMPITVSNEEYKLESIEEIGTHKTEDIEEVSSSLRDESNSNFVVTTGKEVSNFKTNSSPENKKLSVIISSKANEDASPRMLRDMGTATPNRTERVVTTTTRNQTLSNSLKQLYEDVCQVCQTRVQIDKGEYLSESHHIQPVNSTHRGPDIDSNIIILCPNHHAMFDRGAITIDLQNNTVIHVDETNVLHGSPILIKHVIDKKYLRYHNQHIFRGKIKGDVAPVSMKNLSQASTNYEKTVIIEDSDNDIITYVLPSIHNRRYMSGIECKLVDVQVNDIISFNGHRYKVIGIF